MMSREAGIAIFILFALVWVIGQAVNGYGGPLRGGQVHLVADRHVTTTETEIYRSNDRDQANKLNKSEVEEYTSETSSGDEYTRQYHESSRYSATARDRDDMLVLCTQL